MNGMFFTMTKFSFITSSIFFMALACFSLSFLIASCNYNIDKSKIILIHMPLSLHYQSLWYIIYVQLIYYHKYENELKNHNTLGQSFSIFCLTGSTDPIFLKTRKKNKRGNIHFYFLNPRLTTIFGCIQMK